MRFTKHLHSYCGHIILVSIQASQFILSIKECSMPESKLTVNVLIAYGVTAVVDERRLSIASMNLAF